MNNNNNHKLNRYFEMFPGMIPLPPRVQQNSQQQQSNIVPSSNLPRSASTIPPPIMPPHIPQTLPSLQQSSITTPSFTSYSVGGTTPLQQQQQQQPFSSSSYIKKDGFVQLIIGMHFFEIYNTYYLHIGPKFSGKTSTLIEAIEKYRLLETIIVKPLINEIDGGGLLINQSYCMCDDQLLGISKEQLIQSQNERKYHGNEIIHENFQFVCSHNGFFVYEIF